MRCSYFLCQLKCYLKPSFSQTTVMVCVSPALRLSQAHSDRGAWEDSVSQHWGSSAPAGSRCHTPVYPGLFLFLDVISFPGCFGPFSPLMPLPNEPAEWFSCTDVLWVSSTVKGRYLSPPARNAISSTLMPNTLFVMGFCWWCWCFFN